MTFDMNLPNYLIYSEYLFCDICVQYLIDNNTQKIGMRIFPACKKNKIAEHRSDLLEHDFMRAGPENLYKMPAWSIEPLVQIKCKGDDYPSCFAQGMTMRNSSSTEKLRLKRQEKIDSDDKIVVITTLETNAGWDCKHYLEWFKGQQYLIVQTEFINHSANDICLEMLSSFTLGHITPFDAKDASERLKLHRFRSFWSSEARKESLFFEDINLERSWLGISAVSERFGQIGSMPVRGYFPFAAIEDCQESVFWGAMLAYNGSWQMEIEKKQDFACISGGLADREFGHWTKLLLPDQSFKTPKAILSVSGSSLEDLCSKLTSYQVVDMKNEPKTESGLPVFFNDWCSFWGDVNQEKILALLDKLSPMDIDYYVIDAGWYKTSDNDWGASHGDWEYSHKKFPKGMKYIADQIKNKGIKPGIWFEFETVGENSNAFGLYKKYLLHRDGFVLKSGKRAFWDFRDDYVNKYLNDKVVTLLKDCGFEYIKIDYNDTIGIGADSADSPGEGLREHLVGVEKFWKHIRREVPGIVIENCSSGGHRLEPLMLSLCDVASFSDAHETDSIPIIAANLHYLIHPVKLLIWAVIRKQYDNKAISYKMAATFLGRPVLSGDIIELHKSSLDIIGEYLKFYKKVSHLIRNGISHINSEIGKSMLYPRGWQSVLRVNQKVNEALLVVHSFGNSKMKSAKIKLMGSSWHITESLLSGVNCEIVDGKIADLTFESDFSSAVILLKKPE